MARSLSEVPVCNCIVFLLCCVKLSRLTLASPSKQMIMIHLIDIYPIFKGTLLLGTLSAVLVGDEETLRTSTRNKGDASIEMFVVFPFVL